MISEDLLNQTGEESNKNNRSVIQIENEKIIQTLSKNIDAKILGDEIRESQVPLPSLIDSMNKSYNNMSAFMLEDRMSLTVLKATTPQKGADDQIFEKHVDKDLFQNNNKQGGPQVTSQAIMEKNVASVQIDQGYETRRSKNDENDDIINKSKLIFYTQESDNLSSLSKNVNNQKNQTDFKRPPSRILERSI